MNKPDTDLTTSSANLLLQMMDDRKKLAAAFFSETGLKPSRALLCHRVDEQGIVRQWFEPRTVIAQTIFLGLQEALTACRTWPSESRAFETQRALLKFAVDIETPQETVEEIANNLTILMP